MKQRSNKVISKRIAIDCRAINMNPFSGVGVYTSNIVNQLIEIDKINQYYLIFKRPIDAYHSSNVKHVVIPFPGTFFNIIWKLMPFPPFDYFFPTPDIFISLNLMLPVLSKKVGKRIVSIHDLAFMKFENICTNRSRTFLKYWVPRSARESDLILCISESTQKDICEIFKIDKKKTVVTHLACDNVFYETLPCDKRDEVLEKYQLATNRYILYHGAIEPRKNLVNLLKAYKLSQARKNNINLVFSGKKAWLSEDIFSAIQSLELQNDVKVLGGVSFKDLPAIYQGGLFFVYPSLYEGFGLPVLEAMASRKAVITSNVSSLPEIGLNFVEYCNPDHVENIASKIDLLIFDEKLRKQLEIGAFKRAKNFSWEKTARDTLELILSA